VKRDISKIVAKRAGLQKRVDALWAQIMSAPAGPERQKKLNEFLALNANGGVLPMLDSLEDFGKFLERQPIAIDMMKAASQGILPDSAWQKSYDEGYQYVVEFCNYDPNLPAPPNPKDSPKTGFRSLQKWHIEALKYRSQTRTATSTRKRQVGPKRKRCTQNTMKARRKTKAPNDLITLLVAEKEFEVSRTTLKRAIKDGRLKSYRPQNSPKNAPHKVSRTQVTSYWYEQH
jgi:hypothetical protein